MSWSYGTLSWYDLCLGGAHDNHSGGACGDCRDNYAHLAWPRISSRGCYYYCITPPNKSCGSLIAVTDECTSLQVWGSVHDCCTCTQAGCSTQGRCWGQVWVS